MPPSPLVLVIGQKRYPLLDVCRIGRDPACQIVLDDPRASRLHATVWLQGGAAFVRDENSANGTTLNGQRLAPGTPAPLHPGDALRCGASVLDVAADSTATVIDPRGWAQPPATGAPTGTFPMAGNLGATIRTPAPDFAPPAAPAPGGQRLQLLALGCGLALVLLLCAGIGLGVTVWRDPLATALAQVNPPGATAGPQPTIPLPPEDGTAAPATIGPGETTLDPNATPGQTPITPAEVAPAPTLLAPEAALASAAGLTEQVAALNQAELAALQLLKSGAAAAELDAALVQVAARAMAVGQTAEMLGQALVAQDGGSDLARKASQDYTSLARLGYSLVIDAHNLRGELALGSLEPADASRLIGEYAARLWSPGFQAAGADGSSADSALLSYASGLNIPPMQPLSADSLQAVLASLSAGTQLQSWLAVSAETITRTIWVPAFAPGRLPPNLADPALAAQLLTVEGQADGDVARQAAAERLRLLVGGDGIAANGAAGGVLRDQGAGPAEALVVTLLSRAVVAHPPQAATAPSPGGAGLAAPAAGNRSQGAAPSSAPAIPGGGLQYWGRSSIEVKLASSAVTSQNLPQILGETPVAASTYLLPVRIAAVASGGISGAGGLEADEIGLTVDLVWDPSRQLSAPLDTEISAACIASPKLRFGGIAGQNLSGVPNSARVVMFIKTWQVYSIQCFVLYEAEVGNHAISGQVMGASQTFAVSVPGINDRDHDGLPDNEDKCPDEPEDDDNIDDKDGCPETDADADGVLDGSDWCAKEAGPPPHGCPEADADGDGVPDYRDKCPNAAEDVDDIQDGDGCPEIDADGDKIRDEDDLCPQISAEDYDGFEDEDGCADQDNDKDEILDWNDRCPNEAETKNDWNDTDGCPDRAPVFLAAGTLSEAATTPDDVHFSFSTTFNLTVDNEARSAGGLLQGTGQAKVEFTCFNVDDHSEIYDRAIVTYRITYQALVNGTSSDVGSAFIMPIEPAGNIAGTLTQPYTHEKCTHLNSGTIPNLGGFVGQGEVTLLVKIDGTTILTLDWKTDLWSSFGSWQGISTVK